MADSLVRLRQLNTAEISGYAVQIIQAILANSGTSVAATGNLTGSFYPLNTNPSGYAASGVFVTTDDLASAIVQISSDVAGLYYPLTNPAGYLQSSGARNFDGHLNIVSGLTVRTGIDVTDVGGAIHNQIVNVDNGWLGIRKAADDTVNAMTLALYGYDNTRLGGLYCEQSGGTYIHVPEATKVCKIVDQSNNDANLTCKGLTQGQNNTVLGDYSHAEGESNTVYGYGAHAEGASNIASGNWSHAEGYSCAAWGDLSHTEGNDSDALGAGSHSEGISCLAYAVGSHAEGSSTSASGSSSHTEGASTVTYGDFSHAEGWLSIAYGDFSHAQGIGTVASGSGQVVMGKYNALDSTSLMIIGNGTGDAARSNIFSSSPTGNILNGTTQMQSGAAASGLQTPQLLMVAQGSTPTSPAAGQIFYHSSSGHFYGYTSAGWKQLDN